MSWGGLGWCRTPLGIMNLDQKPDDYGDYVGGAWCPFNCFVDQCHPRYEQYPVQTPQYELGVVIDVCLPPGWSIGLFLAQTPFFATPAVQGANGLMC